MWFRYDPAIVQLIPDRSQLIRPKPGWAFGLRYEMRSPMHKKLTEWKYKAKPSVDLFVTGTLGTPFLVVESQTNFGNEATGEHQLANSFVKAHDILCSLNVQSDLFVLGIVQVSYSCHMYISFSTRQQDEDEKVYTDSVGILLCNMYVLTSTDFHHEVGDCYA